eukprot:XP_014782658.1 PREDICTED: uncharacterized protein LOC106878077 isoform X2 [Octopus bimaculoides]
MAAEDNEITLSTEQPTRYNIGPITAKSTVRIWGRFRTFSGLTATEWLFLSMSLINIVIAICLTIYQLVKAVSEKHYVDIIFTILILINAGFCVFYTIHGLLRERAYELLALVAAMIVIFIYCIVQASVNKNLETVKLVRLIIASILVPLNIGLATLVVRRFGWLEFKIVGASEALQNMYKQATLFSTLLKFDLQVTVSVVILTLSLRFNNLANLKPNTMELVVLFIGIPISLGWDFLGYVLMKKESKIGVLVFILVGFLKPGYYLFKTITLYIHLSNLPSNSNDLTEKFMIYCILTSVTIALFVWALLMIELFFVQRNFNKGLKERVYPNDAFRYRQNNINEPEMESG